MKLNVVWICCCVHYCVYTYKLHWLWNIFIIEHYWYYNVFKVPMCFISILLWFVSLFGSKVLYLHFQIGVQHNFNVWWCSCGLILPRRVSLEEREMLALPEHLNLLPVFSEVRVARYLVLVFCVVWCRSLSIHFLLAIVLSVRLLIIYLVSSGFKIVYGFNKFEMITEMTL